MDQVGFFVFETYDLALELTADDGSNPLDGYNEIVVTIAQGSTKVDITGDALGVEDNTINVHLTQEQTAKFSPSANPNQTATARIQVNVYYENTERDVSVQGELAVYDNLYRKVMP